MIKIGIIPTRQPSDRENNPYEFSYKVFDKFAEPIIKIGAMPIVVMPVNRVLPKCLLDECDAFIICGGSKVEDYFYETINYAINNNKPLLGICLGAQAIAIYSLLEDAIGNTKNVTKEILMDAYQKLKEKKVYFLRPVEGHYVERISNDNFEINSHDIKLVRDSKLYNIYKTDVIHEISMHHYAINLYGNNVKVVGKYNDVIEAIEYKDKNLFIVGVQYHPELNYDNLNIYYALKEEAEKRKVQK